MYMDTGLSHSETVNRLAKRAAKQSMVHLANIRRPPEIPKRQHLSVKCNERRSKRRKGTMPHWEGNQRAVTIHELLGATGLRM